MSDFGLAQKDDNENLENLKKVRGTPPYMSPEIFSKEGKSEKASDIWALGILTFEMVELLRPFIAQDRSSRTI